MRNSSQQLEATHAMAMEQQQAIDLARNAQVTFEVQIQEWKNLLLRAHQPGAFDKYREAFVKEGDAAAGNSRHHRAAVGRRQPGRRCGRARQRPCVSSPRACAAPSPSFTPERGGWRGQASQRRQCGLHRRQRVPHPA